MKTMTAAVPATLAFARELFTRGTDVFGAEEIAQVFRIPINGHLNPPPIPFSEAELKRARELNQYLVLQADKTADGRQVTMKRIHAELGNRLGDGKLLKDIDWYKKEAFFTDDVPTLGWRLVSREVIPASASADYVEQTQALADYLANEVYRGEELPEAYQSAVKEFESRKAELEKLRGNDWDKAAEELAGLKLNQLFREKPVEVLYGLVVQHEINHERLLGTMYTWTNKRSLGGGLVFVGSCGSNGVGVDYDGPDFSGLGLGVRFSRSAVPN